MKRAKKKNTKKVSLRTCLILFLLAPILGIVIVVVGQYISSEVQKCEEKGGVYDLAHCRDKTIDEQFAAKCDKGVSNNSRFFSCEEIAERGLKKAYVESGLVIHGNDIYEKGSDEEVAAGKKAHDYCVSDGESWDYLYSNTCVILRYTYMACASGHCYLDEREDYKNGFVAYFPQNYSWESFRSAFYGKGPIMVCGVIELYDGHPQIQINNPSKQIVFNPQIYLNGSYLIYKNACR